MCVCVCVCVSACQCEKVYSLLSKYYNPFKVRTGRWPPRPCPSKQPINTYKQPINVQVGLRVHVRQVVVGVPELCHSGGGEGDHKANIREQTLGKI